MAWVRVLFEPAVGMTTGWHMATHKLPDKTTSADVEAFLRKVAATPPARVTGRHGRLMFAMDATASRERAWDHACHLQAEMFDVTAALGGLDVQLCWYRGFREFEASEWLADSAALRARMTAVRCLGGHTQIARVLGHAIAETRAARVHALVFVGDCMEENVDDLCRLAGELGILGVPLFLFHEGDDPTARHAFEQMARLSGGACCRFDAASAGQLRDLLAAVAVYAAGGRRALEDLGRQRGTAVKRLARQIRGG